MIDTLCFSGGSLNCINFVGSLKYLLDNNYVDINKIDNYVGSSGGTIVALMLVLGYDIDFIYDFVATFDFTLLIHINSIDNIMTNKSIGSSKYIIHLMSLFIHNKFNIYNCTLLELYNLTNKKFIMSVTNYSNGKMESFDYLTTPDINILDSLKASIAIPGIFESLYYNNNYYVDGCVTNHYPINYCNENTTIGFLIIVKFQKKNKPSNFIDFMKNSFRIFLYNTLINKKYNKNTIKFVTDDVNMSNFNKSNILILLKKGIETTKIYMNNNTF